MLPHPDKAHRGGEDAFFIADGPSLHARSRGRPPSALSPPSPRPPSPAHPSALTSSPSASCAATADAALKAHDDEDPEDPHHPHHHAAFGVADGVGGWAEVGVDAGAYARMLMDCARDEAERAMLEAAEASAARRRRQKGGGEGACSSPSADASSSAAAAGPAPDNDDHDDADNEPPKLSAQDILERAFYRTDVQGSSTACVLVLNGATLAASNLGDSGFCVVRGGATAFQSPQQQHNFNFPYQLGSAESMSDQPQAAMRFEMEVAPGDIVIVGSDGLWDNVFAEEVAAIVSRCRAGGTPPDEAAATLARYARMRAADAKHHSPFSYAAVAAGYVYVGGKMDDIAVIVAYVEDAHSSASKGAEAEGKGAAAAAAAEEEGAASAPAAADGDEQRPRSRL
jgi:serine/threonine protein phosphatase PrpC